MNIHKFRTRQLRFIQRLLLFAIMMAILLGVARGAYSVLRPIQQSGGIINQLYLYGETADSGSQHRGIDWLHGTGTGVYAIADGTVVAIREDVSDNTNPANKEFGNYVMIRHSRHTQYDRTISRLTYVYSIYAHLKRDSIVPTVSDSVTANTKIAEVNNTGNSTGAHLHLQINLSEHMTQTNPEKWTWSQNTSRNPESWIQAFNYNNTTTASIMGKITNSAATPVPDLTIGGMQKPLAAEGDPSNDFLTVQTYSQSWANPDDNYVDNFATTDIQPGTYCLEAKNLNGSLFRSLGCYSFVAGRTTYVGLYPVYLPDLRTGDGWSSQIVIVNNSNSDIAHVVTNFYIGIGDLYNQHNAYLAPRATLTLSPQSTGAAEIIGSQDLSVVVIHERSSPTYVTDAYVGVARPDTDVRVPIVQKGNSGWNSDLFIQNTSNSSTNYTLEFVPRSGSSCSPCTSGSSLLVPHARSKIYVGDLSYLSTPFIGSVRITANQPLSVASTQFNGNSQSYSQLMETSNSQPPASVLYAPLVQNNNSGWLSGVTLSRTGGGVFDLNYYNHDTGGNPCYSQTGQTANPYIAYAAIPTPVPFGVNPCSSKTPLSVFQSGSTMVANVNQLQGATNATTYAAIADQGKAIVVAKFRRDSGWSDGFVIANPGSVAANVTVSLYNANGTLNRTIPNVSPVGAKRSVTIYSQPEIPAGFNGSAVVTSDQPVVVSANSYKPGGGDSIGSYPAVHR